MLESVLFLFGRSGETQTRDPRIPNAVRYQLRYTPILLFNYTTFFISGQISGQINYC